MYAPVLGQSAAIDELFVKLRTTLEAEQAHKHAMLRAATHSRIRTQWELGWQAELAQLMGAMDVLLAGAMPSIGGHQSGPENNLGPLPSTTGSAA